MTINFKPEIQNIVNEIVDLLVRKREDYGNSFDEIWSKFGILSVIVRLNDKIARLNNLTTTKKVNFESVDDTFRDIIGYCLLALRQLK